MPFLAGFYSRNFILETFSMRYVNMFGFFLLFVSTGLTVCYSFRLFYFFYVVSFSHFLYATQAPRVSRGIVLLFSRTFGTRWGGGSAPRPGRLYPRERPGTHFAGGWVGFRAGLDGRKISSPSGFDPGPSSL